MITVKEYLENKSLLEVTTYIPYANKVDIINAMLKEVTRDDEGLCTLDSVMLDRVKTQIFISMYTNIDMGQKIDDLDSYDYLVKNKMLDEIESFYSDEIAILEKILSLSIEDFYRNKASMQAYTHFKTKHFLNFLSEKVSLLLEKLDNIDTDKIISSLKDKIETISKSK